MARKEVSRTEIFENMPVYRAILTLAIPNVINQLANVIYNLADTFFIGRLNNSSMVAALSLTAPVMLVLTAISNLFCVGSCAVIAAAMGSKDRKKAEDVAVLAPFMALAAGILTSVLIILFPETIALYSGATAANIEYVKQYQFWVLAMNAVPILCSTTIGAGLRGRGYSKYEMYGITLGNILNVILDPVFIFVFNMGVAGAGAATFVSTAVSLLFFLFIAAGMQKKEHLYTPLREFRFSGSYAMQILATGFPAFLHNLITSVTNTVQMNVIKSNPDAAVAALGIGRKIEHTFGQVIIGMTQGVIPLMSYNFAAKKYSRLKEITKKSLILCMGWGLIAVIVLFPFPAAVMKLFIKDEATVSYGIGLVRIYSFLPLCICPQCNIRTFLQSVGEKKLSSFFSILRQIVIYIPMLLLLDRFFGFYGAAFTNVGTDIIAGIIGIPLYIHVMKKARAHCDELQP